MMKFQTLASLLVLWSSASWADAPRVVTDIAPVHALVAQVMADVGAPELLVAQGASPHAYALRPSQARNLQEAGLVIWFGPELTPWLQKPQNTLAERAEVLALLGVPDTVRHAFREGSDAGDMAHADHDHEDHGDEHAHEDHDGEAYERDHGHGDGHAHDHHGLDPHAWLDPENAEIWLGAIADRLPSLDPENADRYRDNAARAKVGLETLQADLSARLASVRERPFVTFHDAFQYFDRRFDLAFAGALTLSDAADPSPAQVVELRERLQAGNIRCAFREPQFNDRLLTAAADGTDLQIGVLDPLGSTLDPGPELYAQLLRDMADSLAACGTE
jgi:zinc transport system substrate-binding protein